MACSLVGDEEEAVEAGVGPRGRAALQRHPQHAAIVAASEEQRRWRAAAAARTAAALVRAVEGGEGGEGGGRASAAEVGVAEAHLSNKTALFVRAGELGFAVAPGAHGACTIVWVDSALRGLARRCLFVGDTVLAVDGQRMVAGADLAEALQVDSLGSTLTLTPPLALSPSLRLITRTRTRVSRCGCASTSQRWRATWSAGSTRFRCSRCGSRRCRWGRRRS